METQFIILLLTGIVAGNDDPCVISKRLPSFELRLKVYKINPITDTALCDRYLINEPGEWFRSENGDEMVNATTDLYECGTEYGIYMIGNVPSINDGIVTRKACLPTIDCSSLNYEIQLKNCGQYTAYFLKRPESCDQAYCFGFGEPGVPPSVATEKPKVMYELQNITGSNEQDLVFKCDFARVDESSQLFYKVFWFINDYKSAIFISKAVEFHQLDTAYLKKSTGLETIKLGVKISCFTRLYNNPKGPPGPSSERSDNFFAGIEPEKTSYTIDRGSDQPISIFFRLTVPFGCKLFNGVVLNCHLGVELTSPGDLTCSQGIYSLDMCGKQVENNNWHDRQSISVKHKNDINRRVITTFEIHLKSRVRFGGEPFWNQVEVPTISIHISEDKNAWKSARCYAQSDPHMQTFMGVRYENQIDGTFTLYKHVDNDGNTNEIQMKVKKCTDANYCTCAIAVRASSDIYVIDRCDEDPKTWRFDFMSCVEDILHVVKKREDEYNYEIHLPTGSYLEVAFGRIGGVYTLELFMNPSSFDTRSMGLCGEVGTTTLYSSQMQDVSNNHPAFVASWKVADKDNMLTQTLEFLQTHFNKTHRARDICICNKTNPQDSGINEEITCTNAKEYGDSCDRDDDVTPVQKGTCYERHRRKKRSTRHSIAYIPDNFVNSWKMTRTKRTTIVSMTKPEAESWCQDFMNQSPGYVACKDVSNVDQSRAVEICVLDILSTNSTEWAIIPREGLKAACLKELLYNDTLKNETDTEDGIPIAQKIKSVNCPLECSGKGNCQNGTCICEDDFGGGDCSININDPPLVFAINRETGGLCDMNFCKEAVVIGDLFLDRPSLACKMQRFQISYEGETTELETSALQGVHNTIADIRCRFPHLVKKRSVTTTSDAFITGYKVSVSNNNRNFSLSHLMYILDSTCQDTLNVSGELKFVLKPGFCFIRGTCINDGYRTGCNTCNVLRDKFEWTYLESEKACSSTGKSHLWIIGVVLAVLLLAIVALLGAIIVKKKYRSVRDASMISENDSIQEKHVN